MTFGTVGFGFFQGSDEFKRKVHYWHIIPACSELGIHSPSMPLSESMASYATGLEVLNQIAVVAQAAQTVQGRSL